MTTAIEAIQFCEDYNDSIQDEVEASLKHNFVISSVFHNEDIRQHIMGYNKEYNSAEWWSKNNHHFTKGKFFCIGGNENVFGRVIEIHWKKTDKNGINPDKIQYSKSKEKFMFHQYRGDLRHNMFAPVKSHRLEYPSKVILEEAEMGRKSTTSLNYKTSKHSAWWCESMGLCESKINAWDLVPITDNQLLRNEYFVYNNMLWERIFLK